LQKYGFTFPLNFIFFTRQKFSTQKVSKGKIAFQVTQKPAK